ncbi:hypothetical protein Daesc_007724 [Daldinia eschscholtzii]|uniref:NACHT domain-containing protein n=1 Tax=Daldinia eschscholtzii TaxID=292717 RepID=A0AAX6MFG5_9PEZI
MDPLSAFSLAAGVVQFTDFAGRLLTNIVKVYKSATGQTSTTMEYSKIASDLRYYIDQIQEKADSLGSITENNTNDRVSQICADCREVCTKLEKALEKLKAKGQTRLEVAQSSFMIVLKGLWTKGDVDTLARQILEIRRNMMDVITIGIWKDAQQGWVDVHHLVGQQNEIFAMLSRVDRTTTDSGQGLTDITNSNDMAIPNASTQHSVAWAKLELPHSSYQEDSPQGKEDLNLCESIRDSLIFKTLTNREKAIPKAYEKTFRWAFEDPRLNKQGNTMWSNFPAWLRGDCTSIYWVAGKPGSGKSTLLKYILSNPLLNTHLDSWAGNRKLLLGRFYFWNAGTMEQKSHLGLLKTLLLECLSKMPQLIPHIAPKRWTFRKIFNKPDELVDPPWSLAELQEAFITLTMGAGESYVIALFIDGLDEFSGDHQELLAFLNEIHQRGRGWAKICVSSRPWNVFEDSFKKSPQLRLENLTKKDIEHYIRSNFESHVGFQEFKEAYEIEAQYLIHSIAEKAHGVFLWVSIVVGSLLETLRDGGSVSELQTIIDELPEKLSNLYDQIFLSIPPKYIQDCSRFLQIREHWNFDLNVEDFWLADKEDALSTDLNKLTSQQKAHIATSMRRKISSRTKGLLEISSAGQVDYLHRTTRDWAVETSNNITAKGPKDFDAHVMGLKTRVVRLIQPGIDSRDETFEHIQHCCGFASQISKYNQNLELVHEIVQKLVASYGFICQGLSYYTMAIAKKNLWARAEDNLASSPNADVILAAQFCIADYVREKVTSDPSMLNKESNKPSILESAILGLSYSAGCGSAFKKLTMGWDFNVSNQREALVTFLLDSGAKFIVYDGLESTPSHSPGVSVIPPTELSPSNYGISYVSAIWALLRNEKYSSQWDDIPWPARAKVAVKYKVPRKIKKWLKGHD